MDYIFPKNTGGEGGGVTTIGYFDTGTPDVNGGSISGTTLYFQSASDTVPGMVNLDTQTFKGTKTFLQPVILNNLTTGSVLFMDGSKRIAEDNANFFWDDSNNILYRGANSGAFTNTMIHSQATVNSYAQINAVNKSSGTSASSDYVATADTGTDTINYVDLFMNSSTYSDSSYAITGALDGGVYVNGGNLVMGTATAAKTIKFHTGGTLAANLRMTIADTALTLAGLATTNTFTGQTSNTAIAGYSFVNSTPATSGNQQYSNYIRQQGQGFGATGSVNQSVAFQFYVKPVQGTTSPTGYWTIESSVNGAAFGNAVNISTAGFIGIGMVPTKPLDITMAADGFALNILRTTCSFNLQAFTGSIQMGTSSAHPLFIYTNNNTRISILSTGQVGIGMSSATAFLDIVAQSSSAASNAPFKLRNSGTTILTTAEVGAFEYGTAGGVNVLWFTRAGTTREGVLTGNLFTGETNVVDTTRSIHVIDQATGATLRIPVCV